MNFDETQLEGCYIKLKLTLRVNGPSPALLKLNVK